MTEAEVDAARLRRRAILTAAAAAWAALAAIVAGILAANGGRFVYALDDPYIHMAIARNLAATGTAGVVPGVYASASSSPLWVAILTPLAAHLPEGAFLAAPLVLNALFGTAAMAVLLRAASRTWPAATTRWQAACALAAAAALPFAMLVPGLAAVGMEHGLHVLLGLVFAVLFLDAPASRRRAGLLAAAAAAAAAARPEGIFMAAVAAAAALAAGRIAEAALVAAGGGAPLLAYGLVNRFHGEDWLPNSVAAKSLVIPAAAQTGPPGLAEKAAYHLTHWSEELATDGGLLILAGCVVAALAYRTGRGTADRRGRGAGVLFLGTLALHVALARVGHFGRYQAYLVATGILALLVLAGGGALAPKPPGRRAAAWALAAAAIFPLTFSRQLYYQAAAFKAGNGIYRQQVSLAEFFRAHYPAEPLAVHDIGALAYLRPGPILDLYGLASVDVLRLRRERRYDAAALDRLAAASGIRVAALYDTWFPLEPRSGVGSRPARWRRVARWRLDGVIAGVASGEVTFYALGGEEEASRLETALREFEPRLPPGVRLTFG